MKSFPLATVLALSLSLPAAASTIVENYVVSPYDCSYNGGDIRDCVFSPVGGIKKGDVFTIKPFEYAFWSLDGGSNLVDSDGIDWYDGAAVYGSGVLPDGSPANYGALLGQYGSSLIFVIGTAGVTLTAEQDGDLHMFVFDTNYEDNSTTLFVAILTLERPDPDGVVPLPAAGFALLGGLTALAALRRPRG